MIAEIVSNGMLSLPSSLAVVGLIPGIILIVFLGAFGLFTSWILIQFKLRHPEGERTLLGSSKESLALVARLFIRHCLFVR